MQILKLDILRKLQVLCGALAALDGVQDFREPLRVNALQQREIPEGVAVRVRDCERLLIAIVITLCLINFSSICLTKPCFIPRSKI
jgi:hypothetical protein